MKRLSEKLFYVIIYVNKRISRREVKQMLKDFIDSIKSISEYDRLKQKKLSKVLLYLLVISLLAGIIITTAVESRYRELLYLLPESYDSKFPNFKIEQGVLTTDNNEKVLIEKDKVAIIFDTSSSADENSLSQYKKGALLLRDSIVIKTSRWSKIEKKWTDFNIDSLNKQKGRELLAAIPSMLIMLNVFIIFGLLLLNIVMSIFIAFIFTLLKRFWKKKLKFMEVYKMTVHSFTLPMVLLALGSVFIGDKIALSSYFYAYYISGVYLILAIGRTDLPKRVKGADKAKANENIKTNEKKQGNKVVKKNKKK